MKSILGIGNALTDIIFSLPDNSFLERFHLPRGGMMHVNDETRRGMLAALENLIRVEIPGGSSANTIASATILGMHGAFIGKVGLDDLGDSYLADLYASGVVPHLFRGKNPSGQSLALETESGGERSFATYLGAALELNPEDVIPELFEGYDYLHIEGYLLQCGSVVEKAMTIARKKGMIISFDLGSYNMVERNLALLQYLVGEYVDILFANEAEARAFTGKEGMESVRTMSGAMSGAMSGGTAVVKLGKNGSLVSKGSLLYRIDAPQVRVVDTVGAGDAYAAGFLYAHSKGAALRECGVAGAAVAAEAVGRVGPKIPKSRLERAKRDILDILKV